MNLKHRKVEIFFGKYRMPEGLPIRNNNQNKIDCRPNPTNIEGPQHHGPRKCYTPRCTSAEPPKNKKQRSVQNPSPHEAATAPPRRRGGNDVSTSCQPKREGPAARLFRQGSGEGQATAPQARKQQPRQSQVSTLTRFAWNRCVFMCQFNPKQRTILQVMEWIADLTSAS